MRLSVACAPADFVERFASTVSALSFFLPSHNHITVGIFALQGRCPVAYEQAINGVRGTLGAFAVLVPKSRAF